MARPNENGWDFVKVGETYQYKEEIMPWLVFIGEVKILEDNSNEKEYSFKLKVLKSNMPPFQQDGFFDVSHVKDIPGIYSGMPQFYEGTEYVYEAKWFSE